MANICDINVIVEGKACDVLEFGKKMIGIRSTIKSSKESLTMANICPLPKVIEAGISIGELTNKHWGIVRDINIDSVDMKQYKDLIAGIERVDKNSIEMLYWSMTCDWGYPDTFFCYATEKYLGISITVESEESGIDLYRVSRFKDGCETVEFDTSNRYLFHMYTGCDLEYVVEDFMEGEFNLDYYLENELKIRNLAEVVVEHSKGDIEWFVNQIISLICKLSSSSKVTITAESMKPLRDAIIKSVNYKGER